jgi:hypothetical protein
MLIACLGKKMPSLISKTNIAQTEEMSFMTTG